MIVGAPGDQKKVLDSLERKLQAAVRQLNGPGDGEMIGTLLQNILGLMGIRKAAPL